MMVAVLSNASRLCCKQAHLTVDTDTKMSFDMRHHRSLMPHHVLWQEHQLSRWAIATHVHSSVVSMQCALLPHMIWSAMLCLRAASVNLEKQAHRDGDSQGASMTRHERGSLQRMRKLNTLLDSLTSEA